jgi:hypothetical protein
MCAKTLPHPSMNDRRDLRGQVSEMGKETTPYRVYDPKLLKAMGMAFDAALNALPHEEGVEIRMRRELALLIIYFADRGEADPARLSRLALVRMTRSEDFDLSQAAPIFRFRLSAKPSFAEHPTTRLSKQISLGIC